MLSLFLCLVSGLGLFVLAFVSVIVVVRVPFEPSTGDGGGAGGTFPEGGKVVYLLAARIFHFLVVVTVVVVD